jgi:hypothetical protein
MDTALAAMPIIDVDTYYTEHPELWTSLGRLAESVQRKILYETAARVYQLPL